MGLAAALPEHEDERRAGSCGLDPPHGAVLVGSVLLGAVVPFTLLVILPTNRRLLAPTLDPDSIEAAALLRRWGRPHAVRSVLSGLAFGILLVCWRVPDP